MSITTFVKLSITLLIGIFAAAHVGASSVTGDVSSLISIVTTKIKLPSV